MNKPKPLAELKMIEPIVQPRAAKLQVERLRVTQGQRGKLPLVEPRSR